jgi:hypothetical protein
MDAQILLCILLVIADVVLWITAIVAPLSSAGRFRMFSCAAILLVVLVADVIGWPWTAVVGGLATWIAAIVAGSLVGDTGRAGSTGS